MIVCIEDEFDLRADLVEELRDAGYETYEAPDGRGGLELILDQRPDVVLCDVTMPGMDGVELFNRLRRDHPDLESTRFIFLSALEDFAHRIDPGFTLDGYLKKPIDFDAILAAVGEQMSLPREPGQAALPRQSKETP
jgi:DNA-binding response OmpR family regulator